MYHMYRVEVQNEGFDWHVYAECKEDVCKMISELDDFIFKRCLDLESTMHCRFNASELINLDRDSQERQEIIRFFSRFYKPFIGQHGAEGGYVLDYRKCSVSTKVKMPYCVMLEYLNPVPNEKFFILSEIEPVYAGGSVINMPDSDVHIRLVTEMDKRNTDFYSNEALIGFAGAKLGFQVKYNGETESGKKDVFIAELNNALQFCQFLNYLPAIDITDVSCL